MWCGTPWMYLEKEENSFMFWFAFCCCDNIIAKRNLGKKEFIWLYKSQVILHPQGQGGIRGRNWMQKRRQRPRENAAYWLAYCLASAHPPFLCSLAHLTRAGTTQSELGPPIPTNNYIKEDALETYPQVNLVCTRFQFLSWSAPFSSMSKLTTEANHATGCFVSAQG